MVFEICLLATLKSSSIRDTAASASTPTGYAHPFFVSQSVAASTTSGAGGNEYKQTIGPVPAIVADGYVNLEDFIRARAVPEIKDLSF
jgi:hypothetical protein